jgi:hypothetical protein
MTIKVPQQLQSEEEFESLMSAAESSIQTMWVMLILFICMKILYQANFSAMLSCICMMQLIIHFKNLSSITLPAPAELTFVQFNMLVNFSPNQYPAIEHYILQVTPEMIGFLDQHSLMVLLIIGLVTAIVLMTILVNLTANLTVINEMIRKQLKALQWNGTIEIIV